MKSYILLVFTKGKACTHIGSHVKFYFCIINHKPNILDVGPHAINDTACGNF